MDSRVFFIFGAGLIGGCIALSIGVPMPFMLGGLFGSASFVLFYENSRSQLPKPSNTFRQVFMALIGAIIGTRFSPELFSLLPDFWISGLALIPFILIGHSGSYFLMRKLSGHNRRDTFFATMPAGIIDAVALAEQMGADIKIVATQHFVRVVIVVTLVPLIFFSWICSIHIWRNTIKRSFLVAPLGAVCNWHCIRIPVLGDIKKLADQRVWCRNYRWYLHAYGRCSVCAFFTVLCTCRFGSSICELCCRWLG